MGDSLSYLDNLLATEDKVFHYTPHSTNMKGIETEKNYDWQVFFP